LRPMRYEKRVARNRLLALVAIFLVILIGILSVVLKNH
jgi:cell division protein FtsB